MSADQITAIGVVVTAVTGLVAAVGVILIQLQAKKTAAAVEDTRAVVQESHVMINSQRETMVARIEQLGDILRQADIVIPSVPVEPDPRKPLT